MLFVLVLVLCVFFFFYEMFFKFCKTSIRGLICLLGHCSEAASLQGHQNIKHKEQVRKASGKKF